MGTGISNCRMTKLKSLKSEIITMISILSGSVKLIISQLYVKFWN